MDMVWWLTYPSEKYEFVNWDDCIIIPNIHGKIIQSCSSHHQPENVRGRNLAAHKKKMDENGVKLTPFPGGTSNRSQVAALAQPALQPGFETTSR